MYTKFRRWCDGGLLDKILQALNDNPDGNTSADYVYVTLVFHTSPDYTNCIYSVPKSAF